MTPTAAVSARGASAKDSNPLVIVSRSSTAAPSAFHPSSGAGNSAAISSCVHPLFIPFAAAETAKAALAVRKMVNRPIRPDLLPVRFKAALFISISSMWRNAPISHF
ncbi:hypothetical protein CW354_14270 [Marinicaulis flavus]|uniref:Uncharacterized protein n=1 Tax=Hyphococcus luteus TaxID=2058213 RepID=A0A2S7K3Z1_9PROT|nr:hypothetical protein CW354_14270 [Marinicaulis flavus]